MEPLDEFSVQPAKHVPSWLSFAMLAAFVAVLTMVGFNTVYASKIYPGVSIYGTYVGGMNKDEAIKAVTDDLEDYKRQSIPVNYATTTIHLSPATINAEFNVAQTVDNALLYGRTGNMRDRFYQQLRTLVGRPTAYSGVTLDHEKLSPLLLVVDKSVNRPVANASFNVSGNSVTVNAGQAGRRLNLGSLVQAIRDRLSRASVTEIAAPIGDLPPIIDTPSLEAMRPQATVYVSGPLQLTISGQNFVLREDQIVAWLKLNRGLPRRFEETKNVADLQPAHQPVTLSLDETKIAAYVAELAGKTDQAGQNAALSIEDGRAVVFRPSRDGRALDQAKALADIKTALAADREGRNLTLAVSVKKPDVSEQNLNDLGIKELIGEGVSYFPGSTAARINNIRLGAAQNNGILVKPGEEFSFNQYFVNVDAEHGWSPGLSIIGDKIYPIFGGGICQVSSTAYRAALMAGLPITARTNHSYAVGFYTQPYGVPGVDATVYNPGVDFKFRNDTGSYILIQTLIQGTTLKFHFYGTKTKSGRIRGPFFIDGSNDATKPSTTIFYRDILDLAGNVVKTDSVTTRYKSSLDFTQVDTP
jgi:vancomycin resistance protein YoaR